MCWRDDIRMTRFCSFCHQKYYGDLGHRNCLVFSNKTVITNTTNREFKPEQHVGVNPNENISCDYGDDD